jgi:hypothetical protein
VTTSPAWKPLLKWREHRLFCFFVALWRRPSHETSSSTIFNNFITSTLFLMLASATYGLFMYTKNEFHVVRHASTQIGLILFLLEGVVRNKIHFLRKQTFHQTSSTVRVKQDCAQPFCK